MRFSKLVLALGSALVCASALAAVPNTNDPTTFLGPTARLGFTSTMNDTMAYSIAGEAGVKNFRVGGTWGWKIADDQRLKISADYLWQNVTYSFFSGNSDQWVQQVSVGGAYQYDIAGMSYAPQFDLNGYYSHAPSKSLSTRTGNFINSLGFLTSFSDARRIAGSNAGGLAPGLSVAPWDGGRVGLLLNYDYVDYNQKNSTPNQDAKGFGGTFRLKQALMDNLDLNLAAAVRKPFNNYAADLAYRHVQFYGDWTLGVFGDYTAGKNTLPNTWNVGLSANYMLDTRCPVAMPRSLKGDLKGETMVPITDNLLAWTAEPAVYLPQVLAIPDGKTTLGCSGPAVAFVGSIPGSLANTGSFSVASNFTGTNLVYSVTTTSPLASGDTVTINSAGTINYSFGNDPPYDVIVTATNSCGTATSNTFSLGQTIPG